MSLPPRSPSLTFWPWGPAFLLPPVHVHRTFVSTLVQQAQPRPGGEVMPTLDMALFDWTDYEDLKPEVWPSAKKKGTSTCLPPRAWAPSPPPPCICSSAQPDQRMSSVGDGRGMESTLERTPQLEIPLSRTCHIA